MDKISLNIVLNKSDHEVYLIIFVLLFSLAGCKSPREVEVGFADGSYVGPLDKNGKKAEREFTSGMMDPFTRDLMKMTFAQVKGHLTGQMESLTKETTTKMSEQEKAYTLGPTDLFTKGISL